MRLLFVFLIFCIKCIAQDSVTEPFLLSVKGRSGFLAAHRGTLGHLSKDRIFGAEVSISKRLSGSKSWHYAYKNPIVGVTFLGTSVGNNAVLGNSLGALAFIDFPMSRSQKHILSAKLSLGLGYISKVYDPQTNPKDVAISSHFNAMLCLGIQGRWYWNSKNALLYSFDLTHLSNGSFTIPNLGLNMPNIGIGYERQIGSQVQQKVAPRTIEKTSFFRNWKSSTIGIVSGKEIFPSGGKRYPVYAISQLVYKQFKPKVAMELAFDIISKQSLFGYRSYIPKTQWSVLQLGAYSGFSLPINRLRIILGMGVYFKDRYDMDNELYHRVGIRYQCDNGLLLNVVLKSHWAKADYTEWGIGYTFKTTKR